MATRLRKTRRLRGGRHMGWGQVGQHRASGHQGGLGVTGMLKHHYSSMLKYEPDHYGHNASKPPHPNTTKKWASIRDLDDLFDAHGGWPEWEPMRVIDLQGAGYQKLLGGGSTSRAYAIRVPKITASAERKIKAAGGEVQLTDEDIPDGGCCVLERRVGETIHTYGYRRHPDPDEESGRFVGRKAALRRAARSQRTEKRWDRYYDEHADTRARDD